MTERSKVISASRTKDMVKYSPGVLASIITGAADCTFGPRAPRRRLDSGEIHTLVLWTKDPANMTGHSELFGALKNLVEGGGRIFLQLTVTSLGSTAVEIDVPDPEAIRTHLEDILLPSGLIVPEAVKLRYDPLLTLKHGRRELGNMKRQKFERILRLFRPLGVTRYVTSYVDFHSYPKVKRRVEALDMEFVEHSSDEIEDFVREMDSRCRSVEACLQVCCNPPLELSESGCIDGRLLNTLMEEALGPSPKCSTTSHNAVGRQRPRCKCTYSHDIGYSPGVTQCYSQGGGCLYCYSQPEALNDTFRDKVTAQLGRLDGNAEVP